jgi:hypothetical protein
MFNHALATDTQGMLSEFGVSTGIVRGCGSP